MHGILLVLVVWGVLTVLVVMTVAVMLVVRVVAMIVVGIVVVVVVVGVVGGGGGLAVLRVGVASSSGNRSGVTLLTAVAIFLVLSPMLVPLV